MAPKLFLEGFEITPIVHILDEAEDNIDQLQMAKQNVKLKNLMKFVEEDWPVQWESLRGMVSAQVEAQEATALVAAAKGSRPQRRAAAKKGVTIVSEEDRKRRG